jgi:hypothetical protein
MFKFQFWIAVRQPGHNTCLLGNVMVVGGGIEGEV